MVTFELSTIAIFIYGTIATVVIGYIIERLLTLHASRIISIQKRSDDFIELVRKYYLPLANLVGGIQAETNPEQEARLKILFFKLAKYLSFYYNFLDEAGGVWIFPKETQEAKVQNYSIKFYKIINLSIFDDNREAIERVIKYYKTYSSFLNFVDQIENLPDYKTFESIYNNGINEKLFESSREFRESILEGVTEERKVWYRLELKKILGNFWKLLGMLKKKTYIDKILKLNKKK